MTEFDNFCFKCCDGLYNPKLPLESQCTGYYMLKKMVDENIEPFSLSEIERWEKNPTMEELLDIPDIRYLRFLHTLLRPHIIKNWQHIKNLKLK